MPATALRAWEQECAAARDAIAGINQHLDKRGPHAERYVMYLLDRASALRANHILSGDLFAPQPELVERIGSLASDMWRQTADA